MGTPGTVGTVGFIFLLVCVGVGPCRSYLDQKAAPLLVRLFEGGPTGRLNRDTQ